MNKILVTCGIDGWKTAHLGSTGKDTQYCLCIGMDLYIEVSRVRVQIKGKYICDAISYAIERLQGCNDRRDCIDRIESSL